MDRLNDGEVEALECLLTVVEGTPIHIEQDVQKEKLTISSPECGSVKINCAINSVSATITQVFKSIINNGTIFEE